MRVMDTKQAKAAARIATVNVCRFITAATFVLSGFV